MTDHPRAPVCGQLFLDGAWHDVVRAEDARALERKLADERAWSVKRDADYARAQNEADAARAELAKCREALRDVAQALQRRVDDTDLMSDAEAEAIEAARAALSSAGNIEEPK